MPSSVSPVEIDALGARAEAMVNTLGTISAESDRLVRLFLTPEHRRAADFVTEWMRAAGLTLSEDALGTVRGRLEGRGKKRLLFGIDVLAFGDEEGSRFPATLASSSACAGIFKPEMLSLADRNGVTLADALSAYGKSRADIPAAAYD